MNNQLEVVLNQKKHIVVPYKTKIMDIVLNNSDVCNDKIVGARINNEIVDFNFEITKNLSIDLIDINDINGYKITQSGLKFVLEVALKEKFGENVDAYFDHSIGSGIFVSIHNYDFKKSDLAILRLAMQDIINKNERIVKLNVMAKEAVSYYERLNLKEKSSNIHNNITNIVRVYKLGKYINYFYTEMPYSTGYLNDFELVYIDKNEIGLILPENNKFNLKEYQTYSGISNVFRNEMALLNKIGYTYVSNVNKSVSLGYARDLIWVAESNFNNEVYEIAKSVIEKGIKYVLVAGPSSSGKTTSAKKLCLCLKSLGYDVLLVSTDDFFVNKVDSPKKSDGSYDLESIECIDMKLLNETLKDIMDGKEVILPKYNFKTGLREYKNNSIKLGKNGIIVIEGIHCLNDKLTNELEKEKKYKVYLSPFMPLKLDRHNYISTTDLRLIRRIIRDNNNRGKSVSETISSWQSVRKGEEDNIFPFIEEADVILNTALFYELGVLKTFAIPLLYSVDNDSKYLEEARRLIRFFESVYPISSEYVGSDSILREFIGGSSFKGEGDK